MKIGVVRGVVLEVRLYVCDIVNSSPSLRKADRMASISSNYNLCAASSHLVAMMQTTHIILWCLRRHKFQTDFTECGRQGDNIGMSSLLQHLVLF